MRSLILFRHGKSDWDAPFTADHERPLAPRGREAARHMGRLLRQTGQLPDLAVSSSAVRARDTLHIAVRAGHWPCPVRVDEALYETSPGATLDWLRRLEGDPQCLLLTGHEPTWSALAGLLIGGGSLRVPTATLLRIDFETEQWSGISAGDGELRWLLPPKLACRLGASSRGS
jgi:phosphohistidine phosphatase